MNRTNVVIFDVDGTLTRSAAVDAECFARAVATALGFHIDTDWSNYHHSTDAGILTEILDRNGGPETNARLVQRTFMRLLSEACVTDPNCCREVPGARKMIDDLHHLPGVQLAIATGAWADSARLKLGMAGIPTNGIPLVSCDDSPSREGILRIASERAAAGIPAQFGMTTYVGDAPWDASAARSVGFRFVGIGGAGNAQRLREAGATAIFEDFTDLNGFIDRLLNASPRYQSHCIV